MIAVNQCAAESTISHRHHRPESENGNYRHANVWNESVSNINGSPGTACRLSGEELGHDSALRLRRSVSRKSNLVTKSAPVISTIVHRLIEPMSSAMRRERIQNQVHRDPPRIVNLDEHALRFAAGIVDANSYGIHKLKCHVSAT